MILPNRKPKDRAGLVDWVTKSMSSFHFSAMLSSVMASSKIDIERNSINYIMYMLYI